MEGMIISAQFNPVKNKWTGMAIEMGVPGTHENYNVVCNSECDGEFFDSEQEAKDYCSQQARFYKRGKEMVNAGFLYPTPTFGT